MSEEFEEFRDTLHPLEREHCLKGSGGYTFALKVFTAGRALGRRETKEEAKLVAISAARAAESIGQLADENTTGRDRMFARSREAVAIAEAIEAIKE